MEADQVLPLLERDIELAQLGALVDLAGEGRGGVALVEGPAGIGKTRLLAAVRKRARQRGVHVLSARGAEVEREFAFGLVRQLFGSVLANAQERASVLSGVAAMAAPLFDWSDAQAGPPPEDALQARLQGLYWLTSNLAERSSVLLAVDDAHWGDAASLRFLSFLVRRLDELPVAVVLAARSGSLGGPGELLEHIRTDPATEIIRPPPLSVGAVATLIGATLARAPDDPFVQACHEVTGGNPFLLRELVGELARRGIKPEADGAGVVKSLGPVPVAQAVTSRVAALQPAASALAVAVAVLGDGADLRHAAAVAQLDVDTAAEAADDLVAIDVFEPGRPLRFVHPIVRAAVYAGLAHAPRARAHRLAARVLAADGVAPEQLAVHLLATDPRDDPAVVATLREAAARALGSGTPELAVTCLRRALDEPPPPELRSQVLLELCLAEARLPGREVLAHLRRGLELTDDPQQRAGIALELARVIGMIADTGSALDLLDEAITDLREGDDDLALRLEAEFITVGRLNPAIRERARQRLVALEERAVPDTLAGAVLLANLALFAVEEGRPADEAAALAERALQRGLLLNEESWVLAYAANTLTWADRVHEAERVWTEALARGRRRGSMTMFILASAWRSHLAYRRGSMADAEQDARLCLNVCRQRDWEGPMPYAVAFLVDALIERGELEAASSAVDDCPSGDAQHYLLDSRGRLRCAQGRLREGLADLLECGRLLEARGGGDNPAIIPWRSSAAGAMVQLGQMEEARALAAEELDLAQRFGAKRAVGVALRAVGLSESGTNQLEVLGLAVATLEASPARLEQARALTELGAALRRAGKRAEAQERLRAALDLAHRCGSTALRQRAHEELLAAGLRPQRFALVGVEALTPSERRVAELAAQGLPNRDIAQSLFVSLKTVEAHLNSVYRKLEVRTRAHLRRALEAQPPLGTSG